MRRFLGLPDGDRRDAFVVAADAMGLPPAAVEKDFWVCWVLGRLQDAPEAGRNLAFRGGTSLSKVWGLIERFSEDIDLVVAPAALGITEDRLPSPLATRTLNARRSKGLDLACEAWTTRKLRPLLSRCLGETLPEGSWRLDVDPANAACLILEYPRVVAGDAYVSGAVRIELGAKADADPTEEAVIRPYVLERLPGLDNQGQVAVRVVSARRTLWEKIFLLHAYASAPARERARRNLSRHAYDVWKMAGTDIATAALADRALWDSVLDNQMAAFRVNGLDYKAPREGILRLVPDGDRRKAMEDDYRELRRSMIHGKSPGFSELMAGLSALEGRIKRLR